MTRLRSTRFGAAGNRLRARRFGAAGVMRLRLWIVRIAAAAAVVYGGSSSVFACEMCFRAEETSMIDGTQAGILVLLAVTLAVQAAFVGFFFYLRTRAKRFAEIELDTEWSQLQRGASRTS